MNARYSPLDTFLELFQRVSNEQSSLPAIHPTDALRADDVKYHRLQPGDLTAFSHSLKIACGAGDASENMFYVFDKIARSLDEQQQYVDLRRLAAWECAIRWAHVEVATSGPEVPELHDSDRRLQVGMACRRLRDRGYGVPIGAFGPSLATGVRQQIVDKVCSLVSRIGGFQIAVRHEGNLRRGLIPITKNDDDLTRIHVRMVAVSPLSYGPASDRVLASALVRAIVGAQVTATQSDERSVRIVQEFSKKIKNIESELSDSDPRVNKRIDIPGYFTNVMWLDLGQLVYLLNRSRSANQALERNLTFGSGDFWTETAILDRGGFLSRK